MKKVTVNGTLTDHHFYLYRGYLQIAALDMKTAGASALWYTHWDPTEPIATRPLSIRKNSTWYTYGHDLTKNVTELYKTDGTIASTYDYAPFGAVTAVGLDQPFQWSSEVYDAELGMVYYNYRHYNPMDGRWIGMDPITEKGSINLYGFINNKLSTIDILGLYSKEVLDYFRKNCKCLLQNAHEYGVPPEAVAMALADEYSTRPSFRKLGGILDDMQDAFAPLGEGGRETILRGADIGIGNINVDTAIGILTEEMNNGGFEFQSKQQMKTYLLTAAGTAHVASAYMKKVVDNISPYIPKNMSAADRNQNYVAGWREGYKKRSDKMKKNKENKGAQYSPVHDKDPEQAQKDFEELHDILKDCLKKS